VDRDCNELRMAATCADRTVLCVSVEEDDDAGDSASRFICGCSSGGTRPRSKRKLMDSESRTPRS